MTGAAQKVINILEEGAEFEVESCKVSHKILAKEMRTILEPLGELCPSNLQRPKSVRASPCECKEILTIRVLGDG